MQLGEVIFGGVGSGLYGMLIFVILAVFLAGLMVGRTPEYLGKKIEAVRDEDGDARPPGPAAGRSRLAPPSASWRRRARPASSTTPARTASARSCTPSPHGHRQQRLAFAGLRREQRRSTTRRSALAMLIGSLPDDRAAARDCRLAGRASSACPPASARCRPTRRSSSVSWSARSCIVGALTFFPALALGPIVEQLLLNAGQTFSTYMNR